MQSFILSSKTYSYAISVYVSHYRKRQLQTHPSQCLLNTTFLLPVGSSINHLIFIFNTITLSGANPCIIVHGNNVLSGSFPSDTFNFKHQLHHSSENNKPAFRHSSIKTQEELHKNHTPTKLLRISTPCTDCIRRPSPHSSFSIPEIQSLWMIEWPSQLLNCIQARFLFPEKSHCAVDIVSQLVLQKDEQLRHPPSAKVQGSLY